MFKFLNYFYKWNWKQLCAAIIGCLLYAIGLNLFIVPNHLYSGGVLGISQLIRSFIVNVLGFSFPFDIAGIINFLFNIPLLLLAYKKISKTFFRRTLICIIFETIFFSIIPIPNKLIVGEILTNVLIGGIICGLGGGLILSAASSGGGTDIIGVVLSMKSKKLSVGKIGVTINIIIYSICGYLYGIPTMIYSIIFSLINSLVVDHSHKQNICSYAIVFTKKDPHNLIDFIVHEFERDATYWEGKGGFNDQKTFIVYSALSKYEVERLERHLGEFDTEAFMVKSEGIGINGNFKKYLTQ